LTAVHEVGLDKVVAALELVGVAREGGAELGDRVVEQRRGVLVHDGHDDDELAVDVERLSGVESRRSPGLATISAP
jgi:hypothetical protein